MKYTLCAPICFIALVMQAKGRIVCRGGSWQSGWVASHVRMVCGKPSVAAACNSFALPIVHNVTNV